MTKVIPTTILIFYLLSRNFSLNEIVLKKLRRPFSSPPLRLFVIKIVKGVSINISFNVVIIPIGISINSNVTLKLIIMLVWDWFSTN